MFNGVEHGHLEYRHDTRSCSMTKVYSPQITFASRLDNTGSDYVLSAGLLRISFTSGVAVRNLIRMNTHPDSHYSGSSVAGRPDDRCS